MVKSSYSKFKDNMSSGVTVTVIPTSEVIPPATDNWRVEQNGDTMTVQEFYKFINDGNNPVKVFDNENDVTKQAIIGKPSCYTSDDEWANCDTLDCNNSYTIQYTVTYNNKSKSVSRTLTEGC